MEDFQDKRNIMSLLVDMKMSRLYYLLLVMKQVIMHLIHMIMLRVEIGDLFLVCLLMALHCQMKAML